MEPFIVSARKYRPQHFEDVVGQQSITRTLLNAIENDHLAQALLFCGPRGVGKTTCARILAKKINEDGTQQDGEDFAFNIFELDAASNNSVDDIRSLIDQVRIPPQVGKYKVYIIDEVHMLSQSAFNAFLKTLEEPPRHAIFILATTEKHKIIPTILSRCQIFDFRRITVKDAAEYLRYIADQQGIEADEEALHMIAQKADGAMRDALSIFDRVVSFAGNTLTRKAVAENLNVLDVDVYFESTDHILHGDIPALLLHFNEILAQGFEGHHYINGLASHFRDLMVCTSEQTVSLLETSEGTRHRYLEQAGQCGDGFLLRALEIANQCDLDYKNSKNHRLLVELALMKLASLSQDQKKKPEHGCDVRLIPAATFHGKPQKKVSAGPATGPVLKPEGKTVTPVQEAAGRPAEPSGYPGVSPKPGGPKTATPESTQKTASGAAAGQDTTRATSAPVADKAPVSPVADNAPAGPAARAEKEAPRAPVEKAKSSEKPAIRIGGEKPAQKVSGLSLSSIRAKKAHQASRNQINTNPEDLPRTPFEEADLQAHWKDFTEQTGRKGRKILAASLGTDLPKLIGDHVIWIELPNGTMKKEVERDQYELMEYLRAKLNNHSIQLKITINEDTARQYAFTPEEKYQKLKEKNPAIDLLRKTFDLEL
ncbi:DNA polymerase III subunit gamma/tau [Robiginitalea sp. SC105]|uniref:DNA polymerase III subunit gamma/tau n=1 Tax=Robiginitalea sp. SC105 TaxID=2762332 RepID=UPI001639A5D0|nr:DNA polymerase III subunit gamma/tau [Robiginitalea sp. SC105]MBC2840220.1 DNA polymerase III subunit gamma/tau [Robiginitalea sp. SC105]